MKHIHWIIQGYDNLEPSGNMTGVTTIDVIASTMEAALVRAKELMTKFGYRVASVVEHDPDIEEPTSKRNN